MTYPESTARIVWCGDIGEDVREIEFEPFPEHAIPEPIIAPTPAPQPVAVPA